MRYPLLAIVFLYAGCFGVPEDAQVDRLTVKAWGGSLASCQQMDVQLGDFTAVRGLCDALDAATTVNVASETVDAIRTGISDSRFAAENVNPPAGCATCPTRSYTVYMSSESEGATSRGRIVPTDSLLNALVPLSPP